MPTADETVTSASRGDTTLEKEEEESEEEEWEEKKTTVKREATITSQDATAAPLEPISEVTEEEAEDFGILVVGGIDFVNLNPDVPLPGKTIMAYVPAANRWRSFASLLYYTYHHGATIVGNNLFIVGKSKVQL